VEVVIDRGKDTCKAHNSEQRNSRPLEYRTEMQNA